MTPNFLYIGIGRAGSTWIYEALRAHPEVCVPAAKDICFFDRQYDLGVDWYRSFFRHCSGRAAVGEISHDYYLQGATAARRIYDFDPGMRLICCLRKPVDRLVSGYIYKRSTEWRADIRFEDHVAAPRIRREMAYYANLKPFYDRFPPQHLLTLFFEDLRRDARDFARQLYDFLGVDAAFPPPVLDRVVNPAHTPRIEPLAHLAFKSAQLMRRAGWANWVGRIKHAPLVEALLFKPHDRRLAVDAAVLRRCHEHYASDYQRLSDLIGRPLPDEWTRFDDR